MFYILLILQNNIHFNVIFLLNFKVEQKLFAYEAPISNYTNIVILVCNISMKI